MYWNQDLIFSSVIGFTVAVLLLRRFIPIAANIGLVDHPNARKDHFHPIPLVGGIAMFVAFLVGVLTLESLPLPHLPLFVGALILVAVGVADDLRGVSVRMRFPVQILASLLLPAWGGILLNDLGRISSAGELVSLGDFAFPLTVFASVGVINAVNMSDGVDGLAGSLTLVTVASLGILAWAGGDSAALNVLLLLASVILAFLFFNLRISGRALVFMGDAGSMFLGLVLAWLLIGFSQGEGRILNPATALWIFALPLIDTVSLMLRRVIRGRSPFKADREHFHHILRAAGFSRKQTLGLVLALALLTATVGLGGFFLGVPEHWMFFGFLTLFGAHFWTIMRAWRVKRFLSRPLFHPERDSV